MKPKTLLIIGNDKGGVTKTSSIGNVADGLQTLGYTVRFLSGDKGSNLTLRKLYPETIHYDVRDESSMDEAMGTAAECDEDIVIFDFPGFSADFVRSYFDSKERDDLANFGLRYVLGIVLTQHPEPISGGISWAKAFVNRAEPMIIANGRDTPEGEPINIRSIPGAEILYKVAKGRVVEIPCFGKNMLRTYNTRYTAVPSAYLRGGEAYKALGLNLLSASPWKRHHAAVVRSLSPLAEWLVGKPIPKPFGTPEPSTPRDSQANDDLERLQAMYSPEAQFRGADGDGAEAAPTAEKNPAGKTKN